VVKAFRSLVITCSLLYFSTSSRPRPPGYTLTPSWKRLTLFAGIKPASTHQALRNFSDPAILLSSTQPGSQEDPTLPTGYARCGRVSLSPCRTDQYTSVKAYHDMATYNMNDGTGGLDASIRFGEEQARAEVCFALSWCPQESNLHRTSETALSTPSTP
jgi:hypothetical protein